MDPAVSVQVVTNRETCQQFADEFEKRAGIQWAQYLLHYAVFEELADALKCCPDVDDKEAIIEAIATTKLDTIAGPVDFTSPVAEGTMHPVKNVYRSPLVSGQWVTGVSEKFKYEFVVVDNTNYPQRQRRPGTLRIGLSRLALLGRRATRG